MRHYEIILLIHPDQSEQVPAMLERYKTLVTAGGGTNVVNVNGVGSVGLASLVNFGQMNIVIPPPTLALAAELEKITPASIDSFFFSNSGAEAVEASVKLARHATGKRNIIIFQIGRAHV